MVLRASVLTVYIKPFKMTWHFEWLLSNKIKIVLGQHHDLIVYSKMIKMSLYKPTIFISGSVSIRSQMCWKVSETDRVPNCRLLLLSVFLHCWCIQVYFLDFCGHHSCGITIMCFSNVQRSSYAEFFQLRKAKH